MITATVKGMISCYLCIITYEIVKIRAYLIFMNNDNLSAMYLGAKRSFLEDHQGHAEIYSSCSSGNFEYVSNFVKYIVRCIIFNVLTVNMFCGTTVGGELSTCIEYNYHFTDILNQMLMYWYNF